MVCCGVFDGVVCCVLCCVVVVVLVNRPSVEDFVQYYEPTTGLHYFGLEINKTRIRVGLNQSPKITDNKHNQVIDTGGRIVTRRKWVRHLQAPMQLMFVAALDCYDQGSPLPLPPLYFLFLFIVFNILILFVFALLSSLFRII